MTTRTRPTGTVLVIAMIFLTVLVALTTAFVVFLGRSRRALTFDDARERGLALAEAGVEKAIWELSRPGTRYRGEADTRFADGFFSVTVKPAEGRARERPPRSGRQDAGATSVTRPSGRDRGREDERPAPAETWTIVATGVLIDELDSPPRRLTSVPTLTVRVEIERRGDGRPRRIRLTDWHPRPRPSAPPTRLTTRRTRPTTAPTTRPSAG